MPKPTWPPAATWRCTTM